jgi:MYXO-CTERM domain-containing protein
MGSAHGWVVEADRIISCVSPLNTTLGSPAGNLAFPLLLVGGLFLLSRRSGGAGGMGGPGGNNPMAFGK